MGRRRRNWKGPAMGPQPEEHKTDPAPPQAQPPTPEAARELGRREGRSSTLGEQQKETDGKIDRIRADAQALETAATILDDAPRGIFPVPHKAETVAVLFALAAGMRLAAGRFTHSDEIPF